MTASEPSRRAWDGTGMAVAFVAASALYVVSLPPGVFWGDSAEFALKAAELRLAPAARAYPLHNALTWALGRALGSPALGANLLSALFGAVTVALLYETGRRLGRSRLAGAAAALALGLAHTFWDYASVAEVYTLHTAFLVGAILLALPLAGAAERSAFPLGFVLGLSLLHHRLIGFAIPCFVVWAVWARPAGQRLRAATRLSRGFAAGAVPFAIVCLASTPTPPPGEEPVAWWFRYVFLGGEKNTAYFLGEGKKSLGESAAYLARWLVLNLPGPALGLAAMGFALAPRFASLRVAWLLYALLAVHVVFPLRYDWTGDQYAFLIPLYPVLALAAAVGVGWLVERGRPRTAWAGTAAVAAAPVALYAAIALTPLGARLLPRLTPDAVRAQFLPIGAGDTVARNPGPWCRENLERLPAGALLHSDWGDGEVYLYLQRVEGVRRDVTVRIFVDKIVFPDADGREQWLSVLPLTRDLPRRVAPVRERLEPMGNGLYRVRP